MLHLISQPVPVVLRGIAILAVGCPSLQLLGQVEPEPSVPEFRPKSGEPIYKIALSSLDISADGASLAAGQGTGKIHVWNLEPRDHENGEDANSSHQRIGYSQSWQAHDDWVVGLKFLQDSRRLVSGGGDHQIRFWDIRAPGQALAALDRHAADVRAVELSADELTIVSAGDDRQVAIGPMPDELRPKDQPSAGKKVRMLDPHPLPITALALASEARRLVTGARDGKIRIFDIADGAQLFELDAHANEVVAVRLVPGSDQFVSGSHDRTLVLWSSAMGYQVARFEGHRQPIIGVDVSPTSDTIASIGQDTIVFNSLANPNQQPAVMKIELASDEQFTCVRYHPDGQRLFASTTLARIFVIDVKRKSTMRILQVPDRERAAGIDGDGAQSPDGKPPGVNSSDR